MEAATTAVIGGDRYAELQVFLNDKFIDGTSARNWDFGYDVDKQSYGKPNETKVKIGDKLVLKTKKMGLGPRRQIRIETRSFLVTRYIVVADDYVFSNDKRPVIGALEND